MRSFFLSYPVTKITLNNTHFSAVGDLSVLPFLDSVESANVVVSGPYLPSLVTFPPSYLGRSHVAVRCTRASTNGGIALLIVNCTRDSQAAELLPLKLAKF